MTVRAYVSADGEVLSNKEYPVKSPLLLIPVYPPAGTAVAVEAASVREITDSHLQWQVYKAITVTIPDGFLTPVAGLIR